MRGFNEDNRSFEGWVLGSSLLLLSNGDRIIFLDDQHLGVFPHSNQTVLMDGFYLRVGWDR
jgi:hypothetical protein